jgi:hypothetical protein
MIGKRVDREEDRKMWFVCASRHFGVTKPGLNFGNCVSGVCDIFNIIKTQLEGLLDSSSVCVGCQSVLWYIYIYIYIYRGWLLL